MNRVLAVNQAGIGLTRVTIAAPRRRVDLALPEDVPVAELLPELLRHGGDGLADDGERHGGWVLRRTDGTLLRPAGSLAGHRVRDGEVLHLVPRHTDWPEPGYDDIVDAIAAEAAATIPAWRSTTTRRATLTVAGVALAFGCVVVLTAGPPWPVPVGCALALGVTLVLAGAVASRALGDAAVGAVLATFGLPYGFLGGLLVLVGEGGPVSLGAAHLLVGCTALVVLGCLGYVGVGAARPPFVAAVTIGIGGALGALVGFAAPATAATAILLGAVSASVAGYPLVGIRLGRLPIPALPDGPAHLRRDYPPPDPTAVSTAVARTDDLLTGMLVGACVLSVGCDVILAGHGGLAGPPLVCTVSVGYLLRARAFRGVRHRLPLMVGGVAGLTLLAVEVVTAVPPGSRAPWVLLGIAALTGAVLAGGLRYSQRPPSPYLARAADVADVVLAVAVLPLVCAVLGLYALVRAAAG